MSWTVSVSPPSCALCKLLSGPYRAAHSRVIGDGRACPSLNPRLKPSQIRLSGRKTLNSMNERKLKTRWSRVEEADRGGEHEDPAAPTALTGSAPSPGTDSCLALTALGEPLSLLVFDRLIPRRVSVSYSCPSWQLRDRPRISRDLTVVEAVENAQGKCNPLPVQLL